MAAPQLRIVRRRKGEALIAAAPPALTAASYPIADPQQIFKTGMNGGRRNDWQNEAWEMTRLVGEFAFYVRFRAKTCGRCRLVASEIDPDTGEPTGSIDPDNAEAVRVAEIVRDIAGGPLGQTELLERFAAHLTVPGESWGVILKRPEGTRWFAVTREEIERGTRNNEVTILLEDGSKHDFNPANGDGMFRVWNRDERKACEATSPARAALPALREIVRTSVKIENIDKSRLANGGLLMLPLEASLPTAQAPVSADKPDGSVEPPPPVPVAQQFQDMFIEVAKIGIADPNSGAALTPIVGSAPAEFLDKIKHIDFGKEMSKVELEKRDNAVGRLAMAVDMSPEQMKGMGESANHWGSRQIEDQDVQVHVAPVMQTICQAIYSSVLRNVLAGEGIDPDKYVLWYDTSDLTADPDLRDEAKAAKDVGAITDAAFVRHLGLPDDALYDLETTEGAVEFLKDAVTKDPTLLPLLAPGIPAFRGIEFPQSQALPAGGGGEPVDAEEVPDPSKGQEPGTENKQPGNESAAVAGLRMALDVWITKALELAGKRRRTRADYARLAAVDMHETHRYLPPVTASEVGALIKGWDVGLDDLAGRHGFDANLVRAMVATETRRQLTAPVVEA